MGKYLGQAGSLVDHEKQFNAPQLGKVNWEKATNIANSVVDVGSNLFGGGSSHDLNKTAFDNAPDDKVTIFWDAAFNGHSESYGPGTFKYLGKAGRDEISSIKVPAGLKLEAWHGGKPVEISQQTDNKHYQEKPTATWTSSTRYVGDSHNDHIDTIRVSYAGGDSTNSTSAGGGNSSGAGNELSNIWNSFPFGGGGQASIPDGTNSNLPATTQPKGAGFGSIAKYLLLAAGVSAAGYAGYEYYQENHK